ncbi:MAG: hypothetical protein HZA46_00745 [Planctomycetales bacterium]|nr:hypothetical protein [Planctomycetales bacterium]
MSRIVSRPSCNVLPSAVARVTVLAYSLAGLAVAADLGPAAGVIPNELPTTRGTISRRDHSRRRIGICF